MNKSIDDVNAEIELLEEKYVESLYGDKLLTSNQWDDKLRLEDLKQYRESIKACDLDVTKTIPLVIQNSEIRIDVHCDRILINDSVINDPVFIVAALKSIAKGNIK